MRWKCRDGSSEWFNIHVLYSPLTGVSSRAVSWGRMSAFSRCEALWPVDLGQSARVFPRNLVGWSWMLVVLPEERGKVALGIILLPSNAREIHFDGSHARVTPKFRGALGACTQFLEMGAQEKRAWRPFLPASRFKGVFEVRKVTSRNEPYIFDA